MIWLILLEWVGNVKIYKLKSRLVTILFLLTVITVTLAGTPKPAQGVQCNSQADCDAYLCQRCEWPVFCWPPLSCSGQCVNAPLGTGCGAAEGGTFFVLTAGQVTLWVALFKMGISQATREHPAMACAGTRMACARHLMALMSTLYATQKEPIQPMHALIKKIRAKTPATAALTMTAMT